MGLSVECGVPGMRMNLTFEMTDGQSHQSETYCYNYMDKFSCLELSISAFVKLLSLIYLKTLQIL